MCEAGWRGLNCSSPDAVSATIAKTDDTEQQNLRRIDFQCDKPRRFVATAWNVCCQACVPSPPPPGTGSLADNRTGDRTPAPWGLPNNCQNFTNVQVPVTISDPAFGDNAHLWVPLVLDGGPRFFPDGIDTMMSKIKGLSGAGANQGGWIFGTRSQPVGYRSIRLLGLDYFMVLKRIHPDQDILNPKNYNVSMTFETQSGAHATFPQTNPCDGKGVAWEWK